MDKSASVEVALFIVSCALFLLYHMWLFYLRGRLHIHRRGYFNVWSRNKHARQEQVACTNHLTLQYRYFRGEWVREICVDGRDALQTYAVQNLRNAITASSFLATTCALVAVNGVGSSVLDINRINRLESISASDPITGGKGAFSATTKLGITEAVIFFSFLCFTQSIRLMVHMTFYARMIPSEYNTDHTFRVEELMSMSIRASLYFTLGLRSFYAFIPLLMWVFGPTWLFIITVLEVVSLIFTDTLPPIKSGDVGRPLEPDLEEGGNSKGGESPSKRRLSNSASKGDNDAVAVHGGD